MGNRSEIHSRYFSRFWVWWIAIRSILKSTIGFGTGRFIVWLESISMNYSQWTLLVCKFHNFLVCAAFEIFHLTLELCWVRNLRPTSLVSYFFLVGVICPPLNEICRCVFPCSSARGLMPLSFASCLCRYKDSDSILK